MEQKDKIEAAKRLINDEGIMNLLTEYLLEFDEHLNATVIQGMSDEQIGQITRGDLVADQKIRERFGRIKNLTMQGTKKSNPAPKS